MVAKIDNRFQTEDVVFTELSRNKVDGSLKLHWIEPLVVLRVNDAWCCVSDQRLSQNARNSIHIHRLRRLFGC